MLRDREFTEIALKKKLEIMKRTLYDLVHKKKGNLLDPDIIRLSQEIDTIINRLQGYQQYLQTKSNPAKYVMNQKTCS